MRRGSAGSSSRGQRRPSTCVASARARARVAAAESWRPSGLVESIAQCRPRRCSSGPEAGRQSPMEAGPGTTCADHRSHQEAASSSVRHHPCHKAAVLLDRRQEVASLEHDLLRPCHKAAALLDHHHHHRHQEVASIDRHCRDRHCQRAGGRMEATQHRRCLVAADPTRTLAACWFGSLAVAHHRREACLLTAVPSRDHRRTPASLVEVEVV